MAGGRPTTLTPSVRENILTAIRAGNYRDVAAEWAGVSVYTLRGWCQRDKRDEEGPFHEFWLALLEAEKSAEILMVGLVVQAARDDAKYAEWYLERKFPERWGRDTARIRALERRLDDLERPAPPSYRASPSPPSAV
jgi:transposase